MLHLVEVVSEAGDSLSLPLGQPTSGLILTGVDGLDPVKATLITSDYAQQDGASFHSARRESRNILLGITLDSRFGGGTIRELRQELYTFFMPKSKVELTFHLENDFEVKIEGIVESMQSPMFSKNPVALVSIMCHQPAFYEDIPNYIEAEAFNTPVEYSADYTGSVETGIELNLFVNGDTTSNGFVVQHRLPNGVVNLLEFKAPLIGNDVVYINTKPGEKTAQLTRNSTVSSIIEGINPTSVWPLLVPGTNHIAIVSTAGQFYYEWFYMRRFGGL